MPEHFSIAGIKARLQNLDWRFIKGSTLLSGAIAIARVLGLAYSLVLARVFSPGDFGSVQYAITLATLVSIGTTPFGMHVIAQYVARQKNQPELLDQTLANLTFLQVAVTVVSGLVAAPFIWLKAPELTLGVLVIFIGQTVFYSYWGLARGFLASGRLAIAYLGSNLVQILMVIFLVQVLHIQSTQLALIIYGTSYFLPLILLHYYKPLAPLGMRLSLLKKEIMQEVFKFSMPIWLSQFGYVLFSAMDILLLEHFVDSSAVGVYRLNVTIATVFTFLPQGISSILLPEVAAAHKDQHSRMLWRAIGIALLTNLVIIVCYLLLLGPFIRYFFGIDYQVENKVALVMALASIISGLNSIVVSVLVGKNRPGTETIGRFVALAVGASLGITLIPRYSIWGASLAVLAGVFSSLVAYSLAWYLGAKKQE